MKRIATKPHVPARNAQPDGHRPQLQRARPAVASVCDRRPLPKLSAATLRAEFRTGASLPTTYFGNRDVGLSSSFTTRSRWSAIDLGLV
jgi:hypothetical protein